MVTTPTYEFLLCQGTLHLGYQRQNLDLRARGLTVL